MPRVWSPLLATSKTASLGTPLAGRAGEETEMADKITSDRTPHNHFITNPFFMTLGMSVYLSTAKSSYCPRRCCEHNERTVYTRLLCISQQRVSHHFQTRWPASTNDY